MKNAGCSPHWSTESHGAFAEPRSRECLNCRLSHPQGLHGPRSWGFEKKVVPVHQRPRCARGGSELFGWDQGLSITDTGVVCGERDEQVM